MASNTSIMSASKNEVDIRNEEINLNISLESDHLDPEQKAAHEADTLPMDGPQAPPAKECNKWTEIAKQCRNYISPILVKDHVSNPNPGMFEKIKYACLCPPHGRIGRLFTYIVLILSLWGSCVSMFGSIATPPNGTIFWLIVLTVIAMVFGWVFSLARLPPLLGMLITGIVIKNIPGVEFDSSWNDYSSTLRSIALVVILMRAGLGLDPGALKRLSGMVIRLAFTPCLVETVVIGISSRILFKYALGYEFPWLWGFLLGFILAAVSPAVVVPSLLELQEKGYGVSKGIPTLVIAAASVDDVLAISGFSILLGLAFQGGVTSMPTSTENSLSPPTVVDVPVLLNVSVSNDLESSGCSDNSTCDSNVAIAVFEGIGTAIKEALVGVLGGIFWGFLCIIAPNKDSKNVVLFRATILIFGGFLALFGSKHPAVGLPGSGALAVLVMAFVAGVGWRKYSKWEQDNHVSEILGKSWLIFQPILFVLIGTEIQVDKLEATSVLIGIGALFIGLVCRIVASYLAVGCGDLTAKERLFVALAWLPKATVQAAVGGQAFDDARKLTPKDGLTVDDIEHYKGLGLNVLTISVLAILITAPIGAIAIKLSAPSLLKKNADLSRSKDGESARDAND